MGCNIPKFGRVRFNFLVQPSHFVYMQYLHEKKHKELQNFIQIAGNLSSGRIVSLETVISHVMVCDA